jgi:hypothetical protein
MGTPVTPVLEIDETRVRTQYNLELAALRRMLRAGRWLGRPKFGLELEIVIVTALGLALHGFNVRIKDALGDTRVVCELGDWQLELNCTPVDPAGTPFTKLHDEIEALLRAINREAAKYGGHAALVGILPTLTLDDTAVEHMTPDHERYEVLDQGLMLHSPHRHVRIQGQDTLDLTVRSIVDEALCTSMQGHYGVNPDNYPDMLDAARIVAGPALAICTNSPIAYGRRLRHANRLAVFGAVTHRTSFEDFWCRTVDQSFLHATALSILLAEEGEKFYEDAMAVLDRGGTPTLRALTLANGTDWSWLRPVYGEDHIRIEDRPDATQPTIKDLLAQFAFKVGLIREIARQMVTDEVAWRDVMNLDTPRRNLEHSQVGGPNTVQQWVINGRLETIGTLELVGEHLIPLARKGLVAWGVHRSDIDWPLEIMEGRARTGQTGSVWQLKRFERELANARGDEVTAAIEMFKAYRRLSDLGSPVHTWPLTA